MDPRRIEDFLRQGPPDEPRYAAAPFRAPQATQAMRITQPTLRPALPVGAGLLLVIVLGAVALFAMLRAGNFNGVGGPPGVQATPPATATPTPGSTRSAAATPSCTDQVQVSITGTEGAAGSRIISFELFNIGAARCTFSVTSASFVDRGRTPAQTAVQAAITPAHRVVLPAGGKTEGMTRWSNQCTAVRGPVVLQFATSSDDRLVSSPLSADSAVPPCNGPGQRATLEVRFQ